MTVTARAPSADGTTKPSGRRAATRSLSPLLAAVLHNMSLVAVVAADGSRLIRCEFS